MEEQNLNSTVLKTTKRDLTDELKSIPLELINGLTESDIRTLQSWNINTLGKLLQTNTDKLYGAFGYRYIREIRPAVMKMGVLFDDDRLAFEDSGISDDIALIPIDNLGISNKVKNALKRQVNIVFLGDLLIYDYENLLRIRTLGEDGIIELKKYIHSLGYKFKNEKPFFIEIRNEYKEKGIPMIQDELSLDLKTCGTLYRHGIYTVQDLLNCGEKVFELVGIGYIGARNLKEAMETKNITFGQQTIINSKETAILPTKTMIDRLKQENLAIQKRIDYKEELVTEYNKLITERQDLIAREQKLDEEIALKIAMLQDEMQKGEETNYGRR